MGRLLRIITAIWAGCVVFVQRQVGKRPAPPGPMHPAPVHGDEAESASTPSAPIANPSRRNISFAPIPPGRLTVVPDKDNWERQAQSDFNNASPLGARLWIEYVDGKGASSERQISVVRFEHCIFDDLIIDAHCQARNGEMRTFLASRVKQAIDLETGEILPDLKQWLLHRYQNSPHHRVTHAITERTAEIGALTFIARLAGKMSKTQREHIAAFIAALDTNSARVPDDSELPIEMVRNIEGTSAEYKSVKRSLKLESEHNRNAFIDCATKIVAARKEASGVQQAALKELIDSR